MRRPRRGAPHSTGVVIWSVVVVVGYINPPWSGRQPRCRHFGASPGRAQVEHVLAVPATNPCDGADANADDEISPAETEAAHESAQLERG